MRQFMQSISIDQQAEEMERRQFQRVKVKIFGRYMLEDRSEHPCHVVDMSAGSISLRCDTVGEPGEKIIAYLDHLGRIEGVSTRRMADGFVMSILASDRKREKIAAQISWLASKESLDLPEGRRHARVAPRNPHSTIELDDGRQYPCRIIDLSLSGAAVEIDVKPAMGMPVVLGTMRGKVVRHFDDGIAIEFATVLPDDVLDTEFTLEQ